MLETVGCWDVEWNCHRGRRVKGKTCSTFFSGVEYDDDDDGPRLSLETGSWIHQVLDC